ncbi:two-component system [Salinisphaera sp. S4-8]|uniref:response regulator n=1 Tax=Salinisphaera sp. S4-8 TaxID=633357 RepID=UPI00333FC963
MQPILIVDDEPENLAALRQILAGERRLVFARSGENALAAARKHSPALILLDIQMPDLNGYEVCRRLKSDADTAAMPVIFVTSMADIGNEAEGFAAGAVDYIVKPVSAPIVRARVRTHLSLVQATRLDQSYRDALNMLGHAGHYNDTDTGVHIWRMAYYTTELARAYGLSAEQLHLIELAAPLHDTGKIGISDTILRKPGKLDAEEWRIMQTHTRIGHDILAKSRAPGFKMAAEIALHHHEKWDGNGYPDGLAGEQISIPARLTAIADVFDALTTTRPYKAAWPVERARDTMLGEAGRHFDPEMIAVFDSIFERILDIKAECDAWEATGDSGFAENMPFVPLSDLDL